MRTAVVIIGAAFSAAFLAAAAATLFQMSIVIAPFAFAVALGYAVVIGAPAYLLLRQVATVRWWHAVVFGFACGALTIIGMEGGSRPLVLVFGTIGAISSMGFWVIVSRAHAPKPIAPPDA
jgi:hypothetical protein